MPTTLGITIDRNSGNTGDTVKDLTTAAGDLPDIAMVDNPKVSTLADAGLLTDSRHERSRRLQHLWRTSSAQA